MAGIILTVPLVAELVSGNGLFEPFYINAIILPRQARDRHRESTQTRETVFSQVLEKGVGAASYQMLRVFCTGAERKRLLSHAVLCDKRHF
jgi:hypothetical protein